LPTWVDTEPINPKAVFTLPFLLKNTKMHVEPNLVVIADDDCDDSLFLLSALLSTFPELTVVTVSNADRLISILEKVSPQFIFLDINMPKKNGFEALKHIRSNKKLVQPTVIMCSTSNSVNDLRSSHELGADGYVTKPTNIKNLNKMVQDIFEIDWASRRTERALEKMHITEEQYAEHKKPLIKKFGTV
jgi:DNA-binding response OmpR family regulator